PRRRRAMPRTLRDGEPARLRSAAADPRGRAHAVDRRGVSDAGAAARHPSGRGPQRSGGARVKLGNLIISGIVTGSIYASFAACVALWYRVSNILNLAVGDFAMIGALGVDNLVRVHHWSLAAAIAAILGGIVVAAYVYDRIVLRLAQDGITRQEGIVVTFFFTFALSFFIEGIAELLYGTDVHAAPAVWSGQSLSLGGGLHVDRAGVLVVAFAVAVGIALALVLRGTLQGK